MDRTLGSALSTRLLLMAGLVFALNLAARPHTLQNDWALARLAQENGLVGPAEASFNRLAASQPWREDLWLSAGRYALQAEHWESALRLFAQVDTTLLTAADWLAMGDAHQALNQDSQAIQAWQRSLSFENSFTAHARLYDAHRQQGNIPASLAELQSMHRLHPNEAGLVYLLAISLAAFQPGDSLAFLEQASTADEAVQKKLEILKQKLGFALQASSPAEQFLASGQALAELQEWPLAAQAFRLAVDANPEYAEAWAYMGESRQHLDPPEIDTALADLRRALRLNPNSVAGNSMLALYWQRRGDLESATIFFRVTAGLEPHNPAWFAALGGLASAQGDLVGAEEYYLHAIDLAPQKAVYQRLLSGFYLINQVQITEKALPAALKAVQLDPTDPANLDILGQVHLLLGDIPNAQSFFLQAQQLEPGFAQAHLHLGMVYLFQGQGDLAYDHLQLAKDLAADPATSAQAQRLLSYYFP